MKNDDAYANAAFIPGGEEYPDRWYHAARVHRELEAAVGRARLNDPYGSGARHRMDIFHPAGPSRGLVVFLHGGYWMESDRTDWSHLAGGATAHGWAVAIPSYTLAPEARLTRIAREVAAAIDHGGRRIAGPIRLAGHSAGGQLVARVLCDGTGLDPSVRARVVSAVPISPVADLRPLIETSMNATLRIDAEEAVRESPALRPAPTGVAVTVWVGADERPAFLDQARGLARAWEAAGLVIEDGRHHFDVIDGLADPESALMRTLLA